MRDPLFLIILGLILMAIGYLCITNNIVNLLVGITFVGGVGCCAAGAIGIAEELFF